jgi:hypothetical protein
MATLNTKTSVVDFIKSTGGDSSFSARAKLAVEHGIVKNVNQFAGSAQQNTSLLSKLQGAPKTTPKAVVNKDDASSFINAGQDEDIASAEDKDAPPSRVSSSDLVDAFKKISGKDSLVPVRDFDTPDFEENFEKLRQQFGVDDLESSINEYDAQEQEIQARLRERLDLEEGKPVALNVISGRVSEAEKQEFRRLDEIGRAKSRAINQMTAANNVIETTMNLRKMDYDAAKSNYDSQFSQNIQLFNTIKGIADFDISEEERMQDNARSNLQIMYDSIQEGGLDIESADASTLSRMSSLELEAGLPQGFYKNIAAVKPDAKVLSTTTRVSGGVKYADVVYKNPDGSLSTQSVRIGASGSSDDSEPSAPAVSFEDYIAAAEQELSMSLRPDTQLYKDLEAQWKTDYPATGTSKFSSTELKKLEFAGLLGASRAEQLEHLFGDDEDDDDNPFN